MKLRVLGCFGGDLKARFPAFLVNDDLLLDAGTIGAALTLQEQLKIQNILLTHHHIDHIVGLPFFADAIFGQKKKTVTIYGLPEVLNYLRLHLLNDIVWPDFTQLPRNSEPTLKCSPVTLMSRFDVDGITVIPIPACHTGPSCGFIIIQGTNCIVYSGDTGCCPEFWESINHILKSSPQLTLSSLVLECSFPSRMEHFAHTTGHLTPNLLFREVRQSGLVGVPILVFHMKPQYIPEIEEEILTHHDSDIQLMSPDTIYEF
jgi:cAMP phosphodiesterase